MIISFVFLVLFLLEIVAFFIAKKTLKRKKVRTGYRVLLLIGIVVFEIITVMLAFYHPHKEVDITGGYIPVSEDYWVMYENDSRELQVRKWFPKGHEEGIEGLPVIIASHGSCGTIDNNLSLYKELASHGYVVIAVGHTGYASSVVMSDGSKINVDSDFIKEMAKLNPQKNEQEAYDAFRTWMEIRVGDLNVVMDDYCNNHGETYFVSLGHSAGGSSAYGIARVRDDVVGVIALESPFMADIEGVVNGDYIFNEESYGIPMLNVYSDSSFSHLKTWKQYRENANLYESTDGDIVNIYYPGVSHMGLCDLSLESPLLAALIDGDIPAVDAYTQLTMINRDILEFLNPQSGGTK